MTIEQQVETEVTRLRALVAICESPLHNAPIGCPYCQRDERQIDILTRLAQEIASLRSENQTLRNLGVTQDEEIERLKAAHTDQEQTP